MKKILSWLCATLLLVLTAACGKANQEITVYVPDGAPALALAEMMAKDTKTDGITYQVVGAAGIESLVQYEDESKNADICVLPLTDASLYLHSGKKYALLGIVTHGNFFFISETEETYTAENLSSLIGKKVGVVQLAKLPGLTLRYVLEREGIPYAVQEGTEAADADKVNLINVAPTSVKGGAEFDLFAVPDPLFSAKTKTGFFQAGSLQTLYGGENGYPQAALVAKQSLIQENPDFIQKFILNISTCASWLASVEISTVLEAVHSHLKEGLTPSFTEQNLTRETIRGCNVYVSIASEKKEEINGFIAALKSVDENAVKPLSDTFFYEYKI